MYIMHYKLPSLATEKVFTTADDLPAVLIVGTKTTGNIKLPGWQVEETTQKN
jgi:hypothetical protein